MEVTLVRVSKPNHRTLATFASISIDAAATAQWKIIPNHSGDEREEVEEEEEEEGGKVKQYLHM